MEFGPEHYAAVLESLPTGIYVVDRDRRIRLWNSGAEAVTGFLSQEMIGRNCPEDLLAHCDERQNCICGAACPLHDTMHDGKPRDMDVFLRHKQGHRVPVRVRTAAIRDDRGSIIGAAQTFDERVHPAAQEPRPHCWPATQADPFTGLPGRERMGEQLEENLTQFSADEIPFGVLGIAVDGLVSLTHARGNLAAEAMLRVVAQTLAKNLRPGDVLGRWSDERFVMVVEQCPQAALARVAGLLQRILGATSLPWWGDNVMVTARVGGAAVHRGDDVAALIERVEEALKEFDSCGEPRVV